MRTVDDTTAVLPICHACGYAIHSSVMVYSGGHTYHQGCVPRHWACGCPIGSDKCAYQKEQAEQALAEMTENGE